ncbi:uncharacterized protein [Pseudochaenichthys georgianus]|uniref:uncharacterized protein n=1 Tax=Pseudochaenichthys georgianus TaxID=52239 RepID=UPI00146F1475|nr:uncharacterized protein LOC117443723 [Pseudochaenichthys georgianus]
MLTRWLTFTAFLCTADGRGSVSVAPTCRVKGHPEAELTLNCGDGKKAGVVQYWHTPFGNLQTPGFHSNMDPVFMLHDGSLKVPNPSLLHRGLYYCLLQHTEGTALWPYELSVGQRRDEEEQEHSGGEQRDEFRFRRDVGSLEEMQAGVSDAHLAGAVAASVLLTFLVGFSAGALSRTPVLRCLGNLSTRFQSQRTTDSEVTMATLSPMYDNQAWDSDADSAHCSTMETTIPPPTNPQRSFRGKRQEEQETTAYLEGCDNMREEEEEEEGKGLKGNNEECDGEAKEEQFNHFYRGEDGESQTQTDEDTASKDGEEKESREGGEEKTEVRKEEEEVEKADREENSSNEDGEEGRGSGEEEEEEEEEDTDSNNDETGSNRGAGETLPPAGRPSRVLRLYQYDEDGQRFAHLPQPAPEEPGPPPRLKQRSLSLKRLNTIMAAASAEPLGTREPGGGEGESRPHLHMEI